MTVMASSRTFLLPARFAVRWTSLSSQNSKYRVARVAGNSSVETKVNCSFPTADPRFFRSRTGSHLLLGSEKTMLRFRFLQVHFRNKSDLWPRSPRGPPGQQEGPPRP